MPFLPTLSLVWLPTRELLLETAPLLPVLPLPQVTAPARSEERRVGKERRSRWSPYDYKEKPLLPTRSLVWLPTRELLLETAPLMPVLPLPQVTAPALLAVPLAQLALSTT